MIATTKLIESYEIIKKGLEAEIETATKAIGENNRLLVDAPEYLKGKIEKRLASLREKRAIRNAKLIFIASFIEDLEGLNQCLDNYAKEKELNDNTLPIALSIQECESIAAAIKKNRQQEDALRYYATFETKYSNEERALIIAHERPGYQSSSYPECIGRQINLYND